MSAVSSLGVASGIPFCRFKGSRRFAGCGRLRRDARRPSPPVPVQLCQPALPTSASRPSDSLRRSLLPCFTFSQRILVSLPVSQPVSPSAASSVSRPLSGSHPSRSFRSAVRRSRDHLAPSRSLAHLSLCFSANYCSWPLFFRLCHHPPLPLSVFAPASRCAASSSSRSFSISTIPCESTLIPLAPHPFSHSRASLLDVYWLLPLFFSLPPPLSLPRALAACLPLPPPVSLAGTHATTVSFLPSSNPSRYPPCFP